MTTTIAWNSLACRLVRGYQSQPDDLLRRDIIQQLTCHFRLDTRALAKNAGTSISGSSFADELTRLEAMAQDGLVRLDAG